MLSAVCIFGAGNNEYIIALTPQASRTYNNPRSGHFRRLVCAYHYICPIAARTVCSSVILMARARNEYIDESIVTNDIDFYMSVLGMSSVLL
jgi:hypothetical protein